MRSNSVSIALCTYNGSSFIRSQIESILYQLEADDEIVVSDDNSSDQTISIIRSFNDHRIKILPQSGKNVGVVRNFFNALGACNSDYIFLCDQDDVWLDNRIDIYLDRMKITDAGIVLGELDVIDETNVIKTSSWLRSTRHLSFTLLDVLIKNPFIGCGMLVHKRVVQLAIAENRPVPMHDWWIGLCAVVSGEKIDYIPQTYTLYRRHGRNASPSVRRRLHLVVRDRLWMLFLLIKFAPKFFEARKNGMGK